jgi:hypothetical protein
MSLELRKQMVSVALEWQERYGVAPAITSVLSEYDAALLVGCAETDYCIGADLRTAVSRGHDFLFNGIRYQVKANRPSGKPGATVTLVAKATNYDWDRLIWILYNKQYEIQEAWLWEVAEYRTQFDEKKRLRPPDMRKGKRIAGTSNQGGS